MNCKLDYYQEEISFKVGDLLVLDESYLKESGSRNITWLVIKKTPLEFQFIDIAGFYEGIQTMSTSIVLHQAWRVIPGETVEASFPIQEEKVK